MIKGVSKRVVEITGTDHEYFEKAVLYLRPDKCGEPAEKINKEAGDYLGRIVSVPRRPAVPFAAKLIIAALLTLLAVLLALLLWLLL